MVKFYDKCILTFEAGMEISDINCYSLQSNFRANSLPRKGCLALLCATDSSADSCPNPFGAQSNHS